MVTNKIWLDAVLRYMACLINCIIHYWISGKNMNKQKALEKLKKSKREALANSSEIKVGRLELNEAMKALRTIIALENVINNR